MPFSVFSGQVVKLNKTSPLTKINKQAHLNTDEAKYYWTSLLWKYLFYINGEKRSIDLLGQCGICLNLNSMRGRNDKHLIV